MVIQIQILDNHVCFQIGLILSGKIYIKLMSIQLWLNIREKKGSWISVWQPIYRKKNFDFKQVNIDPLLHSTWADRVG